MLSVNYYTIKVTTAMVNSKYKNKEMNIDMNMLILFLYIQTVKKAQLLSNQLNAQTNAVLYINIGYECLIYM